MGNMNRLIDQHVNELLSGLLDGELTQQERQMVSLHCEGCEECRENLANLEALRERIGKAGLSEVGEDKWRENMKDPMVQTTRSIGWLIFIGGMLAVAGIALFTFTFGTDISIQEKLIGFAIYGGLAALFLSVLRQRLIERKTDKYKDVEI
ncbi:MAG: putative anti-sigma-YlaC factor YlaD [Lysobacterales bacterium]|jgi:predicted anti-sigma-YlaC factor YlaD